MSIPQVIGRCPVCDNELNVTRLECPACDTAIEGRFRLSRFQRLSAEQLAFLEVFVKNRGTIKDIEAELGISYPTVRARLDDVIRTLGYNVQRPAETVDRRAVLEALDRGEITAEEALKRLRGE